MSAVINHRNIFFGGLAPKVKGIKAKINKWNLIKHERAGLKLSPQKMKIMASGPITSWYIDGK